MIGSYFAECVPSWDAFLLWRQGFSFRQFLWIEFVYDLKHQFGFNLMANFFIDDIAAVTVFVVKGTFGKRSYVGCVMPKNLGEGFAVT